MRRVFSAMRRSLARWEIAFTSASVGLRSDSRSVSRTQGLASRKPFVRNSCSISGSVNVHCMKLKLQKTKKGEAGFPPPLWSLSGLRRFVRTRRTRLVHRLFGCDIRHRENRYERAAVCFGTKFDMAFDLGEQSMVSAHADIKAGVPGGAALTRDDVARNHMFAAKGLDAKALALGITSVTR